MKEKLLDSNSKNQKIIRTVGVIFIIILSLSLFGCSSTKDNPKDIVPSEKDTSNNETNNEVPSNNDSNDISAEFKAAMDSYEAFIDEYIEFLKKYNNNPSDTSLLSDYANYLSKYTQFLSDFEKWDNEDLNAKETAYYLEVQTRVTNKLLEITY